MSIDRSQATTQQVDTTQRTSNDKGDARAREPAPPEKVDQFRRLLETRQQHGEVKQQGQAAKPEGANGEHAIDDAVARRQGLPERQDEHGLRHHRDDTGATLNQQQVTDAATLFQAQMAIRDGAAQPAPAPLNPNAFADMVEKHLKQLAVDRGDGSSDGRVLLRMADATLPGTDLLLSKTADGWLLRADVRSRNSYDAIRDAAPALARRFAERNLGTLSIEPHFHG